MFTTNQSTATRALKLSNLIESCCPALKCVVEFHRPGEAARLIPEEASPGAEAYFVDSSFKDKHGAPYIVARLR
jgi:hypothetical protein